MPHGIYLSVKNNHKSVVKLVNQMVESIGDKNKYYDFFKWHNHYSYHSPEETADIDPYCLFCSFLNNIDYSKVSVVESFSKWWNPHRSSHEPSASYDIRVFRRPKDF